MIDYEKMLESVVARRGVPFEFDAEPTVYTFHDKIIPKGRPRAGKGGRMFTPEPTRRFEAKVKAWGKECGMVPHSYPIRVRLTLFDQTDDKLDVFMSEHGLSFADKGDVDNYGKAVLDALNGVAYKDDKQIVDLHIVRRYWGVEGFMLAIERAGLTKMEAANLKKYLRKANVTG